MTVSGQDMIRDVREYLHDTGRGTATENFMYDEKEILRRLTEAKRRVTKALLRHPPVPGYPASVTAARFIKTCVATTGTSVPTDFQGLLAGKKSDGTFVPKEIMSVGETMLAGGHDVVFVRGGTFLGTADVALYEAQATEDITPSNVTLTEFCDGVYDAITILASRELLPQEQSDNADRWKYFSQLFMRIAPSFH